MDTPLSRASLVYTEVQNLHSTVMDDSYQISVWFPFEYPVAGHKYPVIYLMDGDIFFGLASSLVFSLVWDDIIPHCLVVGVGHGVSTYEDWWKVRSVDLNTPENLKAEPPRRAPDFLRFLKTELIPFVEATYPVDPGDRCLFGYSWGGQFSLYALFHEPDLFQRYFVGSAIWEYMLPHYLAYEEAYAKQRSCLPVRVFFSVCSLEDDQAPYFPQFIEALKRRNYDGLRLDAIVIEGETHVSGIPISYNQALRALYKA